MCNDFPLHPRIVRPAWNTQFAIARRKQLDNSGNGVVYLISRLLRATALDVSDASGLKDTKIARGADNKWSAGVHGVSIGEFSRARA